MSNNLTKLSNIQNSKYCERMAAVKLTCDKIQDPCPLIRKLVNLMDDSMSAGFSERFEMLLSEFLRASTYAFWLRDLPYVVRLIGILSSRIDREPSLRPHLKQILNICLIPPMLTRSSEILEYERDLQEYFSSFGYLLASLRDTELQDMVFSAIRHLLQRNDKVGICCVSVDNCKKAVEQSLLPEIVIELLEISEKQYYKKLLKLTEILAESDRICQAMVKSNVLNTLILRLVPEEDTFSEFKTSLLILMSTKFRRTDMLDHTLKILLSLLDACRRSSEKFKSELEAPSCNAFKCLNYILRMLSLDTLSKVQRNATLSIFVLCVETFSHIPVLGILPDNIAILCAASVCEAQETWASEIKFTNDEYDFRFMEMILLLLCYYPKFPDSLKYFRKKESLARILLLINTKVQLIWTTRQRSKIMFLSLHVLTNCAPIVIEQFLLHNGPVRLLSITKMFMTEGFDEKILYSCLQCIFATVKVENTAVLNKYREKFGIDVMLCLVDSLLKKNILTMEIQETITYAFTILQLLNKGFDYSNQKAMTICIPYMKRFLCPNADDMVQNPKLLIALLDFVWENISWSPSNLNHFVKQGCVYHLLDIIEKCCSPVKLIGLSMLVDLCEEGSCIPHLLTWRGQHTTLIPLLLKLFRIESKKLGARRTERGSIADIELPLMGTLQWEKTFGCVKCLKCSPASIDLLGTVRPKIYSILHLLTCRYQEKVKMSNMHYKISNNVYSIDDQITKLVAENYLPLKLGEVWVELQKDLEIASIRPVACDQNLLSTVIQRFYKWSSHIKTVQEEVLKRERDQDGIDERLLYRLLKETRLASSLQALRELRYIARCTEALFRLMAKMKQKDRLQASLGYGEAFCAKFHATFNNATHVTPVFNQKISICSNVIIDPNEDPFDLKPASVPESQVLLKDYFSNS